MTLGIGLARPSRAGRALQAAAAGCTAVALMAMLAAPTSAQPAPPAAYNAPLPASTVAGHQSATDPDGSPMTMETFLDRLMIAESGGRADARNPRSTALGPFQFIESTFLAVARHYFTAETQSMTPLQILALRTDLKFARRAAEAYTRENAALLQSMDVAPSYPNLRLAFLLGPVGAAKVLKAPPEAPLAGLLAPAVLVANPFMATMTARGLAQRSAREVAQPVTSTDGVVVAPGTMLPRRAMPPGLVVRCNLRLPSCKRWLALHSAKSGARGIAVNKAVAAGQAIAASRGRANALTRRGGRVSPTMEAAARGIPLKQSPLRSGAKGKSPIGKLARNRN